MALRRVKQFVETTVSKRSHLDRLKEIDELACLYYGRSDHSGTKLQIFWPEKTF